MCQLICSQLTFWLALNYVIITIIGARGDMSAASDDFDPKS